MKTFAIATFGLIASPFVSAAAVLSDATPRSDTPVQVADVEKRADCGITAKWYNNWPSGGYRRYGIKLTAYPASRRHDLLEIYCALVKGNDDGIVNNRACYSNNDSDGSYNADITTFEGSHGHDLYRSFFQDRFNDWRARTNCDVDNRNM